MPVRTTRQCKSHIAIVEVLHADMTRLSFDGSRIAGSTAHRSSRGACAAFLAPALESIQPRIRETDFHIVFIES